jgi:preprotein translocase subunit YajC
MAEGAAPQGGSMLDLLPLGILFIVMYFLMIRPQQKRAKEHRELVGGLKKGDEVVTTGGLLGKIVEAGDNFVTLDMGKNTEIKVQRQAVASVMPKGTIKEN